MFTSIRARIVALCVAIVVVALAANAVLNYVVANSYNADASESLLAIRAAELAEEGKTGEEIFKTLESLVPKTFLYGMLESPKWLEAGGRLSHALSVILSQMQKIGRDRF